ncbi:MAG: pilus assembly PilX N-terminal domain-containing protein [Syntrophomonadaceae bacterium]|nr:pilus assembly PilX N-terminal domain-containing protein [Syntrophomonadaceae bacterium]MDD3023811.1 pilus assembly PilX N-terminal domain-containing protein [Syntrophomonadaceae bacterium]
MISKKTGLDEDGNLMIMVLMVFLLISVLVTAVISVASMENKISHYALNEQQAQQSADAGVEWAIEEIWQQGLPQVFRAQLAIGEMIKTDVNSTAREFLEMRNNGNSKSQQKCRYQFTAKSDYCGVKKEVTVEIVYTYSGVMPVDYEQAEIMSYKTN